MVEAPGLFSTMTDWPKRSANAAGGWTGHIVESRLAVRRDQPNRFRREILRQALATPSEKKSAARAVLKDGAVLEAVVEGRQGPPISDGGGTWIQENRTRFA